MKKEVLIAVVGIVALIAGYFIGSYVPVSGITGTSLNSEVDSFAYAAGLTSGIQIQEFAVQGDFTDELNGESFLAGVKDGMDSNEKTMSRMDAQMSIQSFVMGRQKVMQEKASKDAEENLLEGQRFLEENKNNPNIQVTESGLQYEVITEGTGVKPGIDDTVEVHYHGTLIDGTVFDSSVDRGETVEFPVNGVISGWTEALQLMGEGAKWKLYIPSDLAYGSRQKSELIKANSTLIFEVELIDVKNK